MDSVIPLPETAKGNSGILNVICKPSKMIRITPIKSNITAPEVAIKFKEHVHRNQGLPSKIISDRDSLFMSKFWKSYLGHLALSRHHQPHIIPKQTANRKSRTEKSRR